MISGEAVANEFVGQGRAFLRSVKAGEPAWRDALPAVTKFALAEYRSRSVAKPGFFYTIEKAWRRIPPDCRVGLSIVRTARSIRIIDRRAAAMRQHHNSWNEGLDEGGLVIAEHVLDLRTGRIPVATTALTITVSHHGLSQFFRRAVVANDTALWQGLALLAEAADGLLARGGEVDHDTPRCRFIGNASTLYSYNGGVPAPVVAIRTIV